MRTVPCIVRLALLAAGIAVPVSARPATGADEIVLYVATNGNDAHSGRLAEPNATATDGPLATLARARDALRELRARAPRPRPASVVVRGGTYYLSEPLRLGPDDSGTSAAPVVYSAYPGEEVVLSGGRPIADWRRKQSGVWVAELAGVEAGSWYFRQLFVGDRRQTRARTPNVDPEHPITGGWLFVGPPPPADGGSGAFGDTLASIHTPGDTFQWKIHAPADGAYSLWCYYGAKNEPHGRTDMAGRTTMQVDDREPVFLENLPDTGDWKEHRWSKTATLDLARGEHRLRWTNVRGGGLDLDAFALVDDPDWKPAGEKPVEPASGHLIVVQAEAFESGEGREFRVSRRPPPVWRDRFHFRPGDLETWPRSPEPEIHIFPAWGWVNAILSVEKIDPEDNMVYVSNRNCSQELRPGNRYFVANVLEALDSPGEWYLDRREGVLHYRPVSEDSVARGVVAPRLHTLVEIAGEAPTDASEDANEDASEDAGDDASGDRASAGPPRFVEHVILRGLTFRHTRYSLEMDSVYQPDDAAVTLGHARHCAVEGCEFPAVGGYAVRLDEMACDNYVLANTVVEAGQGGVLLAGDATETQPKRNVIAGNRIERCGRIWKHVAGVYVTTGSDNRVAHNTITDVPRYGISLKTYRPGFASHGNVIEYNRLLRTNVETNDTGAIETLGRDREASGNVIRHNLILDSIGLKTTETGEILTPYYTWGIYLDDYSSGTHVQGNIVARTFRAGAHVHLGRENVFENNVFVDGQEQQFECNGRELMTDNVFRRNVVYFHTGNLIRVRRWSDDVFAECDANVYWNPGVDLTAAGGPLTPLGPWSKWQAAGYDARSLVADPLFVDPTKDDYRLRPDSPALGLGFQPIDVDQIGHQAYTRPEGAP